MTAFKIIAIKDNDYGCSDSFLCLKRKIVTMTILSHFWNMHARLKCGCSGLGKSLAAISLLFWRFFCCESTAGFPIVKLLIYIPSIYRLNWCVEQLGYRF